MNIIIESNNSRIRAAMTIFLETTTEIKKGKEKKVALSPKARATWKGEKKTAYLNPIAFSPLHTLQLLFIAQHP